MKLIDTHIHFWDPKHLRYGWLDDTPLNKPFLPADLPVAGEGWHMEQLVFVQADCLPEQGLAEVEWVTELSASDDRIQGIVAFAPLDNHNFHAYLTRVTKNTLVKGVRQLIQSEESGFAKQEHFIDAVRTLPEYGLSFDICITHDQLPDVITLVQQCPDVSFVLDHVGKPDIKGGELKSWRRLINRLAECNNVHCKISGMVTEADLDNWTPDDLRPYVEAVVDAFGVSRLMFGGDYPVLELANTDYARWVQTATVLLNDLSDRERQQVFYDNALKFYRLEGK